METVVYLYLPLNNRETIVFPHFSNEREKEEKKRE